MSIEKKKNGKYYYNFMQGGIRRHGLCKGCYDRSSAEEYERDERHKLSLITRGLLAPERPKVTFAQLSKEYMHYSELNKVSYKTDESRIRILSNIIRHNQLISEILPKDIENIKLKLLERVKPATVNRYRDLLSSMFRYAVNNNYIDFNPVKGVKKLREENFVIRYLTKEEEIRLFNALPDYLKPIVTCALHTGMRMGEILSLKWINVDLKKRCIDLTKTKNSHPRKIDMSEKMYNLFRNMKTLNIDSSEYVFKNSKTGTRYKDIHQGFNDALKIASIKNFRFHDLRHTVATTLVAHNVDLVVVKDILGHSNIQTTMRYAHSLPELKKQAITVLNDFANI